MRKRTRIKSDHRDDRPVAPAQAPKPAAWRVWLQKSFVTEERVVTSLSRIGYTLTGLALVGMAIFLWIGHATRPVIFDDQLVSRMLNTEPKGSERTYVAYPGQEYGMMPVAGEKDNAILVDIGPEKPAGFIVPASWVHIPPNAKTLGLSIHAGYVGHPYFYWGFSKASPRVEDLRQGENACKVDCIPNNGEKIFIFTTMPFYYQKEILPINWETGDFFFITIHSDKPTELALLKLVFTGHTTSGVR